MANRGKSAKGKAAVATPVQAETKGSPANRSTDQAWDVFRMSELAFETGIPDLATNANHYLLGHPNLHHQ